MPEIISNHPTLTQVHDAVFMVKLPAFRHPSWRNIASYPKYCEILLDVISTLISCESPPIWFRGSWLDISYIAILDNVYQYSLMLLIDSTYLLQQGTVAAFSYVYF